MKEEILDSNKFWNRIIDNWDIDIEELTPKLEKYVIQKQIELLELVQYWGKQNILGMIEVQLENLNSKLKEYE